MKIVVCVQHVPDTASRVRIAADGASLDTAGVKMIVSPFDEYALEMALQLRDAGTDCEIVALSAGPAAARGALRHALAMGADRAILIEDPRFERADALARARALAYTVKRESPQLCLTGKYGVGRDEGQTAPMLGELLGQPHAANVAGLDLAEGRFVARRAVEGAIEVLEGRLPAVISCDKAAREPRYPSLKGIMAAKKKPLVTLPAAETGVELDVPAVIWETLELPAERAGCRMIDGDAEEAARTLLRLLREEAKVIG